MDYNKIIVAHPGRQHSFRVAEALEKNHMLYQYATTVYDKDSSVWMKITKRFLGKDNLSRANKRKMKTVDDSKVVQFCELRGLLLLLIRRIDRKRALTNRMEKWVSVSFQKKLAKHIIKNDIGVVISYDTNSAVLFRILEEKAPGVIRIIDDAHPNRNYLYKVYNENLASSGEFVRTYAACGYLLDKEYAEQFGDEAKQADIHIVASQFSYRAVRYNGFTQENVIIAPYGVDKTVFAPMDKDYRHGLKILFVGEINQRKGVAQMLEAAKELSNCDIEFNLVGLGREHCAELYDPYESYVNFCGRVSFEELQRYYGTSHIFIFPSMGEGFGLVLLEALSAGLPIIASRNCGAPDIVEEGYNGFLIDAGSTEQLVEKILWFYRHMDRLPQMQQNAQDSVRQKTWEAYEAALVKGLKDKIGYFTEIKAKNK